MNNHELLRLYLRENSQAAFAALVNRHVDLVYSAALRQVRLSHLAEEVAQTVFVDLARQARMLPDDQPLSAWLYVVTRRTSIDVVRREVRRREGEQSAATLATMRTESTGWTEIAAVLDEAMAALDAADRSAVLLRYFENRSLREVGESLGISEDTAQKRVSRALDRLRVFFSKRGVAVGSVALAAGLSAQAVQIAPLGLGATISSGAASISAISFQASASAATKTIAMTTLQKAAAVASFAAIGGLGLYEANLHASESAAVLALHTAVSRASAEIQALRSERTASDTALNAVEQEINARLAPARSSFPGDAALEAKMKDWFSRLDKIKEALVRYPQLAIPELQLLSDERWVMLAGGKPLDSEQDIREVTSKLRHSAENLFAPKLSKALRNYLQAHQGILPSTAQELAPYFDEPPDPAILGRYEVLRTGKLSDLSPADQRSIVAAKVPADPELDAYWMIGPNSYGNRPAVGENLMAAVRAFQRANPGQEPAASNQLRPFLMWSLSEEVLEKNFSRLRASKP